jgi:hypothetical protein
MEAQCTIANGPDYVTVRVLHYERPGISDPCDANWLRCVLESRLGPFSGGLSVSFETYDFVRFSSAIDELDRNITGSAEFTCSEDHLRLTLVGDKTGHVRVSGEIRAGNGTSTIMCFEFETDQTFITKLSRELRMICQLFPVLK